jgi:tight adherence protein C
VSRASWLPPFFLIAALLLAAVATLLVVLTLLPGEVRAPELRGYRETKRRRSLEHPLMRLIWPLAVLLTWYARLVPGRRWRGALERRLVDAGEPMGMSPDELIGLNLAVVVVFLATAFLLDQSNHFGGAIYLVALGFGAAAPHLQLAEIVQQRFKAINRGLPPVLDLVVMAMVAGGDFTNSLALVVSKWSRKKEPLYDELSRFLSDLQLGVTRREALQSFAARAPTELVKTFVGSVIEAEQRGTPLVEILAIQAEVARTKRFQLAETIAGRAGALVKLPLFLILAACLLILFGGMVVKFSQGDVL